MEHLYSHTIALCPVCHAKVPARIIDRDSRIYLEKFCSAHGRSDTMICSDARWYRESMGYVKPGQNPLSRCVQEFSGCPESCGLCPEHQQHTCLPVIEITTSCDLNCPICLKNPHKSFEMTVREFENILDCLLAYEGTVPVINLSGGEPTLHPEIEKILRLPAAKGIMQTTISTNGLKLLSDAHLREVLRETGTIVALQFDGFHRETSQTLRGIELTEKKQQLIRILEAEGINYSLVATVVKGINDCEITALVDFFFESQALSLMFQPAAFTGRAADFRSDKHRVTIPDVVREIEQSRYVSEGDFNPLPCSHYSCFALAYYIIVDKGNYLSLKDFLGKETYLDVIANRTLPGLDHSSYAMIKEKIYEFWSAADSSSSNEDILKRIRRVLLEMDSSAFSAQKAFMLGASSMKAIFIHQFMDVDTLDFGRLIKCCNHYPQPNGCLIPMCALNVIECVFPTL